ncbi:rRNA adenine N-6-methyltransferase family protein [Allorhizocola rhizosphaerae]|uniref:rRNA adenine N-6-methyltransferase family protein n=1 Tax=Allorhizocola rhizosphaerae TaxID=1872709 RepID=UPI000E3BE69B|nr:rRNA adenine N-6-methyltransferase family protein [Allorhizocola rhizosphaerae]
MRAGGRSRRAWGWHPLSADWAERVVADAGIRPGDLVLDIGAGTGALTAPLVRAGARVLAIELHPGRVARLRERFAGEQVTVVHVDARELLLPHKPFKVVSSPPYAVSSELLRTLTARSSRLVSAHLVLQRAFVHRIVSRWDSRARWHAVPGRPLPRTAFTPPPQVDSRVLVLSRR